MADNTGALQARALLIALYEEVEHISCKLETLEQREPRHSPRGAMHDHRLMSELRRELYEAHRHIDGLHRRFPETLRAPSGPTASARVS